MTQSCPATRIGMIRPIPADRLGPIMRICYWPAPILATPHVSPVAMAESRAALRGPAFFVAKNTSAHWLCRSLLGLAKGAMARRWQSPG